MKLPPSEISFFEWLKKNDNIVWNDLWNEDEDLYQVSIDLLPQFSDNRNGFPICDLQDGLNYYFTDHWEGTKWEGGRASATSSSGATR